jgi:predicted nucleic acid-binding protein
MQLADTSAWFASKRDQETGKTLAREVANGTVGTCPMVMLELLASARNGSDFDQVQGDLEALRQYPIGQPQWRRAIQIYRELAHQGGSHQRSVGHQDLLIAAAAEAGDVELLHYDEDFDRIAAVTGQPTRWLAPKGSL